MAQDLKAALIEFVRFAQTLRGDEKSEAQTFLDHFFRALGHDGVIEAGATFEFRREAFRSALEQASPDVVAVNGWNNFGSVAAANCCVDRGIPMVVMSESARRDEPRAWWGSEGI